MEWNVVSFSDKTGGKPSLPQGFVTSAVGQSNVSLCLTAQTLIWTHSYGDLLNSLFCLIRANYIHIRQSKWIFELLFIPIAVSSSLMSMLILLGLPRSPQTWLPQPGHFKTWSVLSFLEESAPVFCWIDAFCKDLTGILTKDPHSLRSLKLA